MILIAAGAIAGALVAAPAVSANADDAPQPVTVLTTPDPMTGPPSFAGGESPWAASITVPANYEIDMTRLNFPVYVLNSNKGAYLADVALYANDGGKPGQLYQRVGSASRGETLNPVENEMVNASITGLTGITLHAGTTYWMVFSGEYNIPMTSKGRPQSDYGLTSSRELMSVNGVWSENWLIRPIFEIQGQPIPVTQPTISSDISSPSQSASVAWKVSFDTAISGLAADDFTLTASGLTGSAITSVTPTGGAPAEEWTVTASTGAGDGSLELAMTDAPARTVINNLPTTSAPITIDKTSPALSIASSVGAQTDLTSIPVELSWDELTSALDPSSLHVTNGTLAPGAAPGDSHVEVIPDEPGPVTITVPAVAVRDAAGNPNRAATWSVDFVPTRIETTGGSVSAGQVYRTQLTSPNASSATYSLFSVPPDLEASLDERAGALAVTTDQSTRLGVHSLTVLIESEGHAYLKTLALDVGPAVSSLAQTGVTTGGTVQAALVLLLAGIVLASIAVYRRLAKAARHQPGD